MGLVCGSTNRRAGDRPSLLAVPALPAKRRLPGWASHGPTWFLPQQCEVPRLHCKQEPCAIRHYPCLAIEPAAAGPRSRWQAIGSCCFIMYSCCAWIPCLGHGRQFARKWFSSNMCCNKRCTQPPCGQDAICSISWCVAYCTANSGRTVPSTQWQSPRGTEDLLQVFWPLQECL